MQAFRKSILTALLVFCSTIIFAQDNASRYLSEGLELQKLGKHTEAVAKFKQALETEPDNAAANYQLAFSLVAEKKGLEAISYAEKVMQTSSPYTAAAYVLLGGIYDASAQAAKAITVYSNGIKAFPNDQNLWFNLGLAYFRDKKYADAEKASVEAIKRDVKHANSQRLYALVAFHQNKRMNALLGLCSFLLADPASPRAEEAYTNIQSILKGGVLKGADTKDLSVTEAKEAAALNAGIAAVINSPAAQKLTGLPLLEYKLKSVFTFAAQSANKKIVKTFFDDFFASYFYKLSQSNAMRPFTELVNSTAEKGGYEKWAHPSPDKALVLAEWIKNTPRKAD